MRSLLVTALVALFFGFGGAAIWSATGLGHGQVREYLLENPEILKEMADNYQKQQTSERLSGVAGDVTKPFPGAVLGNPDGKVTLVEFTDYGCSYCRMSREHVENLIAKNPDLKVVIREWAIFQGSDQAAKMALAAAQQGKFAQFHKNMFLQGPPSAASILAAAKTSGLDLAKAQSFIESKESDVELARNMSIAQQLGFTGTPSWVVGGAVLEGAIGEDGLQEAIDAARES
ncbi:MAG: DsbA family protein [Pontixanthobacter sp.]